LYKSPSTIIKIPFF